jgi:hypothetical protein
MTKRAATRVILCFIVYMVVGGSARFAASHADISHPAHTTLNVLFGVVSLVALVLFGRALRRVERTYDQ